MRQKTILKKGPKYAYGIPSFEFYYRVFLMLHDLAHRHRPNLVYNGIVASYYKPYIKMYANIYIMNMLSII